MRVYYNPINFNITGLSYYPANSNDPFFDTEDPIAEQIFLGKVKNTRYKIAISENGSPQIKARQSVLLTAIPPDQRICCIDKETSPADLHITQQLNSKLITVSLTEWAFKLWETEELVNRKVYLIACRNKDPYSPLWAKMITRDEISSLSFSMSYEGSDNITFFTPKLFNSYSHEIISS